MTRPCPLTLLRTTVLLAAIGSVQGVGAQDARFLPIPGRSATPGTNANFCGLSGTAGWSGVRVRGDGQVLGGSVRQIGVGPGGSDFTAGAIATPAGTQVLTATCPQAGVTDLTPAGDIAVGFEQAGPTMRAFRWQASTGLVYLDATVVVGDYLRFGQPRTRAFVWTPTSGLVDLQDELVQQRGLGAELAGWQLLTATDVDFSGNTIVGQGINPNGCEQAFVVRLPRVVATTMSYSVACVGPAGALTLASTTRPYVGSNFLGECAGALAGASHFAVYGLQTAATPLTGVTALGGPCDLLTTPVVTLFAPTVAGVARSSFAIPNQPAVAGLAIYLQMLQLETSATGAPLVLRGSNGLALTLGSY
jgi:hypothetical protein